jgi:hypothetical protein
VRRAILRIAEFSHIFPSTVLAFDSRQALSRECAIKCRSDELDGSRRDFKPVAFLSETKPSAGEFKNADSHPRAATMERAVVDPRRVRARTGNPVPIGGDVRFFC